MGGNLLLLSTLQLLVTTRIAVTLATPLDELATNPAEINLEEFEETTSRTWLRDRLLHELLQERHPLPNTQDLRLESFLWSGTEGEAHHEGDAARENELLSSSAASSSTLNGPSWPEHRLTLGPEYLLRTVLKSNVSVLHNDIHAFKRDMETRLTKAFVLSLERNTKPLKQRVKRDTSDEENSTNKKHENASSEKNITTHIHNIRSALPPEPQVELIYSIHQNNEPVRSSEAVSVLCHLSVSDMQSVLGQQIETRAETYTSSSSSSSLMVTKAARYDFGQSASGWMWVVMACLISVLLLLTLLTLLVLIKRWRSPYTRSLLVASPDHGSNNTRDEEAKMAARMTTKTSMDESYEIDFGMKGAPDSKNLETGANVFQSNLLASMKSQMNVETKDLDERNNVSPEVVPRRPKPNRRIRLQSSSTSAFPVRNTPAMKLAPLKEEWSDVNDNMAPTSANVDGFDEEEDDVVVRKNKKWPFFDKRDMDSSSNADCSSSTGSSETLATQVAEMATQTEIRKGEKTGNSSVTTTTTTRITKRRRAGGNRVDPMANGSRRPRSTRSTTSATSVDVVVHDDHDDEDEGKQRFLQTETRRHSSTTPITATSDPTFAMRQRHWETYAQGRKQPHHGRLLPGSSTSDEDNHNVVAIDDEDGNPDNLGNERPVIDAIKQELSKFDRVRRDNDEEDGFN